MSQQHTTVSQAEIIERLEHLKRGLAQRAAGDEDPAFPLETRDEAGELQDLIDLLSRHRMHSPDGRDRQATPADFAGGEESQARGQAFTPAELSKLRDHVVNLNQGFFSDDGQFTTTQGDVDRIFEGTLRNRAEAAQKAGKKLPIVFSAHGGLVDEAGGLSGALRQVDWWNDNQIYPLFFVWETGFLNTVEHLLIGVQQRSLAVGARDIFDFTSDPVVEGLARAAGGPKIWGGMKRSAEIAARPGQAGQPPGGAFYVAGKLKALCDAFPNTVELHAVGHSAGAIFHAHFLPAALGLGVPPFESLQFLAPAVDVDTFKQNLLNGPVVKLGQQIKKFVMYSMKQDLEKADNCAHIYHKSLLYLIYFALEEHPRVDLLGLEESVWRDPDLKKMFGLDGTTPHAGDSVWSQTGAPKGRNASESISHGGFDDDRATMDSVLRHILGRSDTDPIVENPSFTEGGRSVELKQVGMVTRFAAVASSTLGGAGVPAVQPALRSAPVGMGRRQALCVGINSYASSPLSGCVADAQLWSRTLRSLGFDVQLLLESNATYDGIRAALRSLLQASAAGDVIVFQYAGHGTSIPHDSAEPDEAMVPFDFFTTGALLVDKELAGLFDTTPAGVNLTCFFDSCNSGDLDRLLLTGAQAVERPRFIKLTPAQLAKYQGFAQRRGLALSPSDRRRGEQRDLSFAACSRSESAFERAGQGDFTLRTTSLLRNGLPALSNREFNDSVRAAFGGAARQHPELDGAIGLFGSPFLQPLAGTPPAMQPSLRTDDSVSAAAHESMPLHTLAQGFRQLADYLDEKG